MRMIFALGTLAAFMAAFTVAGEVRAEAKTCDAADFAAAVDKSGANLRDITARDQPKLQEKLRRYKELKKLSDDTYQDSALDAIQDARIEELDQQSSALLMKVDTLGRVPPGTTPDCSKLDEVKSASAELDAVIKAKSDYMLQRLDQKIAEAEASAGGGAAPRPAEKIEKADKGDKADRQEKKADTKSAAKAASPAAPAPKARGAREREAKVAAAPPVDIEQKELPADRPNDAYSPSAAAAAAGADDGYTIEEIRDATRGFFGTISTNLATVIEHAFNQSGRPTAYVLGTEGGGAFIAGFRYGKGTLYMRSMPGTRNVYWHGPSLGTDLGASGSRTMFLIYRMHQPDDLYRGFTGIDGSAYFVGGVGLTLLKGGNVIMAPIRSGVGMRLGANVGYVRFTDTATWNPF